MRNMNTKMKKSSFLISVIFAVVVLSISVNSVLAMDPIRAQKTGVWCYIFPGAKLNLCNELDIDLEFAQKYCPHCPLELAMAFCPCRPTPGLSGCQYADQKCAEWINNDECDWTIGVHICKGVCSDINSLAYCSQVAAAAAVKAAQAGIMTPLYTYPSWSGLVELKDYVPIGGYCKNDVDCQVRDKNNNLLEPFARCAKTLFIPPFTGKACCRITGGACTVQSDCCSSNSKCINGICQICGETDAKCGTGYPSCCSGNACSFWSRTCQPAVGYFRSWQWRAPVPMDVTSVAAIAVVLAIAILAIMFGMMRLTKKKR